MVWISFVLTHVRGIEARRDHINAFILPIVEFHSVDMLSHNLSHFSCHYKLQIIGKHFTRTVIGCSYFLIHILTPFFMVSQLSLIFQPCILSLGLRNFIGTCLHHIDEPFDLISCYAFPP
jgi:hypothetical protein